jgi:hypothetical protein
MPFQSVGDELHRFKAGNLHSGKGGPVVKSRAQAIAIALSEERRAKGGHSESAEGGTGKGTMAHESSESRAKKAAERKRKMQRQLAASR